MRFFDFNGGGRTFLVVKPRGTGKTTLICGDKEKNINGLLTSEKYFRYYFDNVIIFHTDYEKDKATYQTLKLNPNHIIHDVNNDTIKTVWDWSKEQWRKDNNTKTLLIFDDCLSVIMGLKSKRNDNWLDHIMANSRGYNISVLCSTQYYKNASTTFRSNLDYFITGPVRNQSEYENIRNDYNIPLITNQQWDRMWYNNLKVKYDTLCFSLMETQPVIHKNFNEEVFINSY